MLQEIAERPLVLSDDSPSNCREMPSARRGIAVLRRLIVCVLAFVVVMAGARQPAGAGDDVSGRWSTRAVPLSSSDPNRRIVVSAPDTQNIAIVEGWRLNVGVRGKIRHPAQDVGIGSLAELLWSPDSKAIVVTQSDGGAVGTWGVTVFVLKPRRVVVIDPSKEAVRRFKTRYTCMEPEEPNIGAVAWSQGSKLLVLAAEVPPHSSCPEMGKVMGYVVAIPTGEVVRDMSPDALKMEWASWLGPRITGP